MHRLFLLVWIALVGVLPVHAQTPEQPPDYRIYPIDQARSDDNSEILVRFGILNTGGAATIESTAILLITSTGEQIGMERVRPLATNEVAEVEFSFPVTLFPPGSTQSLQAIVGIDEVEQATAGTIGNNTARIGGIAIPEYEPAADAEQQGAPEAETTTEPETGRPAGRPGFTIPGINFEVDLMNPLHAAAIIAICGIGLVLLWVMTVILRLLFAKPPTMSAWQPPYTPIGVIDPNSATGRRQLWQPHAQNDSLPLPCSDGTYQIRKLLLGTDGSVLSGWKITGMRLSQYDMYGRVARSQTIAANNIANRLNKLAHRKQPLDREKALKQAKPIAKQLVGQFQKKLSKRNAMLPIAFDVRFKGDHGEVRILFELFGCQRGQWAMIDHWEPEMTVLRGTIQENFTYTIFGQKPDEDIKTYKRRLLDEVTILLADMVTRQRATPASVTPPTVETPPVEQYTPQDTSPHPPIES